MAHARSPRDRAVVVDFERFRAAREAHRLPLFEAADAPPPPRAAPGPTLTTRGIAHRQRMLRFLTAR